MDAELYSVFVSNTCELTQSDSVVQVDVEVRRSQERASWPENVGGVRF